MNVSKRILTALSLSLLFQLPFAVFAETEDSRCEAFDGTTASLYKCNGKVVEFVATVARAGFIEQHPVGMGDKPECVGGKFVVSEGTPQCVGGKFEIRRKVETYGTIHDASDEASSGQLVFTSSKSIDCKKLFRMLGRVNLVNLGGPPNTKGGYGRAWIDVLEFQCAD